jgi:gamma-glutamyltranspeptidase/glutathione hydrolase
VEGDRPLYDGELGRQAARDMEGGGGLLTVGDLAAYRVIERRPLQLPYRGTHLLTNPQPSLGGLLLGHLLSLLEARDPRALGHGSTAHLALLAAVMEEGGRWRARGGLIRDRLGDAEVARGRERVRTASSGTTHLSLCDAHGNVASMTTSNGEGSGYLVPGTGIMLNNMLGEDDLHPDGFHAGTPGERVASMMSPSLVLRGGRVALVLGSGGSKRIGTALLQVVSSVVDFGMGVQAAVEAPRIHWDGDRLQAEPGLHRAAVAALDGRWPVNPWAVRDMYFGGVHAVVPGDQGAADPRRGGQAQAIG